MTYKIAEWIIFNIGGKVVAKKLSKGTPPTNSLLAELGGKRIFFIFMKWIFTQYFPQKCTRLLRPRMGASSTLFPFYKDLHLQTVLLVHIPIIHTTHMCSVSHLQFLIQDRIQCISNWICKFRLCIFKGRTCKILLFVYFKYTINYTINNNAIEQQEIVSGH